MGDGQKDEKSILNTFTSGGYISIDDVVNEMDRLRVDLCQRIQENFGQIGQENVVFDKRG